MEVELPNPQVLSAIIDGGNTQNHIVTMDGCDSTTLLDGFTIRDGNANGTVVSGNDSGAGMLVVGGGYIGLELGSVYAALGTRVSVVEMMPGLLPGADRDLVKVLGKRVETTFESVMVNTRVDRIKELKSGIKVTFDGEGAPEAPVTYDKVLAH